MLVVLFAHLPVRLKQAVCAWLAPGHSYRMEMIRMEDQSYVLDPFARCKHCGLLLPEAVLNKLVLEIDAADQLEDEVW